MVVDASTPSSTVMEKSRVPVRPDGLRSSLVLSYTLLGATIVCFAVIGQSMKHPIPEGKYQVEDGTLIDIASFDPAELGPYPTCHPHHGEHELELENGTKVWVKNSDAPNGGPYPVGHPDNAKWLNMSAAYWKKQNEENRFTWKGLQPTLHMLLMATLSAILAGRHSVWAFTDPMQFRKKDDVMPSSLAYVLPFFASGVLFGVFALLRLFPTYAKFVFPGVVLFACALGFAQSADDIAAVLRNRRQEPLFKLPYIDEYVSPMRIFGFVFGICMIAAYVYSRHWVLNNIFGVSFCLTAIRSLQLPKLLTGAVMLMGLFVYDVFWVFGSKEIFGSNVMVTVALGVEGPVKLLFPKVLTGCGKLGHSMLGLGDVVVPGFFIAFLAKWDAVNIDEKVYKSFVYFNAVIVAYVLSLATTVSCMLFFDSAQPALLYIVPYVLITTLLVAFARGEFNALWNFEIKDGPVDDVQNENNEKMDDEDKKGK